MIKNIPNKYTKKMLLKEMEHQFSDSFDFFYLPIDFNNNCNMGYAFVNFKENEILRKFYLEFDGRKWNKFKSEKICSVKYARIQGFENCKKHFKDSFLLDRQSGMRPYITREN